MYIPTACNVVNLYNRETTVLSYGNLIAERLDNRYAKNNQKNDIDLNNIQFVW